MNAILSFFNKCTVHNNVLNPNEGMHNVRLYPLVREERREKYDSAKTAMNNQLHATMFRLEIPQILRLFGASWEPVTSPNPVRHVRGKITVGWVQVRVFCCRKTEEIYLLLSDIVIDRVII